MCFLAASALLLISSITYTITLSFKEIENKGKGTTSFVCNSKLGKKKLREQKKKRERKSKKREKKKRLEH